MNWQWLCLVAAGGAAGAVARGVAASLAQAARLSAPWGTLLVNALGSALIGWLMGAMPDTSGLAAARWHALLVTGFCGGFTTFSAFSWQTFDQLNRGETTAALANIAASLVLCLFAVWAGFRLARAW